MTLILVRKLLRDIRWPLLVVWLLLFSFSGLWVKIAHSVTTEIAPFFNTLGQLANLGGKKEVKETFDKVVFAGPGKVSQAVLGGSNINFNNPLDFLAVQMLHPVVMVLACLWGIGRAAGAVSGEIEKGTMELLLSQPVPRDRLIFAHLLVDLLVIPIICSANLAGTQFGLWVVGDFVVDYRSINELDLPAFMKSNRPAETLVFSARDQWGAAVELAALMFAISGLTMLYSACGRSRWRVIGWAVLTVLVMFILNVLGQLWGEIAFLRPLSVFYYYQPQNIWLHKQWLLDLGEVWNGGKPMFQVPPVLVLGAIGTGGYLLALRVFTRRDLPSPL